MQRFTTVLLVIIFALKHSARAGNVVCRTQSLQQKLSELVLGDQKMRAAQQSNSAQEAADADIELSAVSSLGLKRFPMINMITDFVEGDTCTKRCQRAAEIFETVNEIIVDSPLPSYMCYGRLQATTLETYPVYHPELWHDAKNLYGKNFDMKTEWYKWRACEHFATYGQVCPGHAGLSTCKCQVELYMLIYEYQSAMKPGSSGSSSMPAGETRSDRTSHLSDEGDHVCSEELQMCWRLEGLAPGWKCDLTLMKDRAKREADVLRYKEDSDYASEDDNSSEIVRAEDSSDATDYTLKCNCNAGQNMCKLFHARAHTIFQYYHHKVDVIKETFEKRHWPEARHPAFI